MTTALLIDPEFQSLIPALSENEAALLTKQILAQGCLQPLCVWKTEDALRILLDGHNRYRICTENSRDYQTVNIKLDSREHAKLWILMHQAGRRNLTDDQRAVVWNDIREQRSVIAVAVRLQVARDAKTAKTSVPAMEAKTTPIERTRTAVAKESQIPESKLRKVAALKKSNPKLYEDVRTGKVTLREAKPTPTPTKKDLRERYSEPDFFARIGRMLAGTLVNQPLLDELLKIQKKHWTPEAEEGFHRIILNLKQVSRRAEEYAKHFNRILREHPGAKKAA